MTLSHLLWVNRKREREKDRGWNISIQQEELGEGDEEAVDRWNLRLLKDNQGRTEQAAGYVVLVLEGPIRVEEVTLCKSWEDGKNYMEKRELGTNPKETKI